MRIFARENWRYAPFFKIVGAPNSGRSELGYTADTLTRFLGWQPYKVAAALNVLALMEEWGHKSEIEQETIRSIIEGFAAGKIELPLLQRKDGRGGDLRFAPTFSPGREGEKTKAYTADTLKQFLGWKPYKVVSS